MTLNKERLKDLAAAILPTAMPVALFSMDYGINLTKWPPFCLGFCLGMLINMAVSLLFIDVLKHSKVSLSIAEEAINVNGQLLEYIEELEAENQELKEKLKQYEPC
jgi:hypothetical protein